MPQAVVQDQDGREFKFYDDLIKDKLVLISFASVDGEKRFPIVDNLVKVQQMVRDRLGKDLFIYTVTTKPQVDTPAALKAFAAKKGAHWQFLTGKTEEIAKIKTTLGVMGSIHGLLWIGNDRSGRWLSKPARLQPLFISESLAFLSTGAQHKQFLKDMRSVKS
jgi:protein SCO1/2